MLSRITVSAALVVSLLAAGSCVVADNTNPKAKDAKEHAAMMQLASAERALFARFDPSAVDKLKGLSEKKDWKLSSQVELDLARALVFSGDKEKGLTDLLRIKEAKKASDPLTSAWASIYASDALCRMGKFSDAAKEASSVASCTASLDDLQPVLQAQKKLAKLIFDKKADASALSSTDPVFSSTVEMALLVEKGDLQSAYDKHQQIISSTKGRYAALATLRLICSEMSYFSHSKDKDLKIVEHAKSLIKGLDQDYPFENWITGKAKLATATSLVAARRDLPAAEEYLRDIVQNDKAENRVPSAYALLAETLYAQKKYQDAAIVANEGLEKYPYSTWSDYMGYLLVDSLYRAGYASAAADKAKELIAAYPDSGWAKAANTMKGVAGK